MAATSEASARHKRADRQHEAHKLRVAGYTQAEIADELGVSQPTIYRDLARHRAFLIAETQDVASVIREDAAAGVRDAIGEAWRILDRYRDQDSQQGEPIDAKAVSALRHVLDGYGRLAKLYGADAPIRVEAVVAGDMTEEQAAKVMAEYDADRS